ncbi:MAG: hypothetical protein V1656_00370, partial [Candidatus Jorgensenbacteria bacterium]
VGDIAYAVVTELPLPDDGDIHYRRQLAFRIAPSKKERRGQKEQISVTHTRHLLSLTPIAFCQGGIMFFVVSLLPPVYHIPLDFATPPLLFGKGRKMRCGIMKI